MTRLESLLHPGETVLWRTESAWRSARSNLLWQIVGLAGGSFFLGLLIDGFDVDRMKSMLAVLLVVAAPIVLGAYFKQGTGVLVTDRRVLRSKGFFRPRREELERRHIAAAVVYEGDETLVLCAARPDAIRLLEPGSRASLRSTGEAEMPFFRASVDNVAVLGALEMAPERIRPVTKPDTVANLHGARLTLAFVVPLLSALGLWVAAELALPALNGLLFALSIVATLGAGALLGLWLVWPVARLAVPLETARFFACTLYHPDWKALYPEAELWRDDLRRAARRLSWLYGAPVELVDLPRPEEPPDAMEMYA